MSILKNVNPKNGHIIWIYKQDHLLMLLVKSTMISYPELAFPFTRRQFDTMAAQLQHHFHCGLQYMSDTINGLVEEQLNHGIPPAKLFILDEMRKLAHMIARTEQNNLGAFVQRRPTTAFPSPARPEMLQELLEAVVEMIQRVTDIEDMKERIVGHREIIRGLRWRQIIENLELCQGNLNHEAHPYLVWQSEPSTPGTSSDEEMEITVMEIEIIINAPVRRSERIRERD